MDSAWPLGPPPQYFVDRLSDLQRRIRGQVWSILRETAPGDLAGVTGDGEGDTIFALDTHADEIVHDFFSEWGRELPLLLIAEGIPGDGGRTYPAGTPRQDVAFTCVVDPIDGTRGLMYQKRSAWILAAVAPPGVTRLPRLDEICVAVQTEVPTPRSHLSDVLWAVRGQGVQARTDNLDTGTGHEFMLRPSRAGSLLYGFATVSRFFPGSGPLSAQIEERLLTGLLPPGRGEPQVFEDQYISSGGQLYELMVGHDRFITDLRPLLLPLSGQEKRSGYAHPYDLCTELIAREAGVIVTDAAGEPLHQSLDIRNRCSWIGYANPELKARIEPVLQEILAEISISAPAGHAGKFGPF